MNNLTGKKWGEIGNKQKEKLLRCAICINGVDGTNVNDGDCIIDFEGFEFSIAGKVVDSEILIDNEEIFYNPCN